MHKTKIMPVAQLIQLIVLASVVQVAPSRAAIEVPAINDETAHESSTKAAWIRIVSEQTNSFKPELKGVTPSTWLVEDYFSLDKYISISFHTNEQTKEEFYQISNEGQLFLVTKSKASGYDGEDEENEMLCELDHRHDHSTLYPWRYKPNLKRLRPSELGSINNLLHDGGQSILGLGSVWLNLLEDSKRNWCQLNESEHVLSCYTPRSGPFGGAPDDRAPLVIQIDFEWPLKASGALESLRRVLVQRRRAIHADQSTLLELIEVEARVKSAEFVNDELKTLDRLRYYMDFCRKTVRKNDSSFPNLMRLIGSSERRVYSSSYLLTTFNYNQTEHPDQTRAIDRLKVQEMFSYELESQVFVVQPQSSGNNESPASAAKFLRIFGVIPNRAVSYRMELDAELEPVECCFASIDSSNLVSVSRLMRRLVPLVGGYEGSSERAMAELVGLGALLMNAADTYGKRKLARGSETSPGIAMHNKWFSYVEWVLNDFHQDRRVHFFFERDSYGDAPQVEIGDLVRVEIHEKYAIEGSLGADQIQSQGQIKVAGGPNEDGLEETEMYRWRIVMELEQLEFSSQMFADEIERTFRAPHLICPPLQLVEPTQHLEEPSVPLPKQDDGDEEDQDDGKSTWLEMPSYFNSPLGTEWTYKVSSNWARLNADGRVISSLELVEWFSHGPQGQLAPQGHLARLDVRQKAGELVSFHLRYAMNATLKLEDGRKYNCTIGRPTSWLEALSWPLDMPGTSSADRAVSLRQYGVAALWSFASEQSDDSLEWLGEFGLENSERKSGLWRVVREDEGAKVPLVFNFTYARQESAEAGVSLAPRLVALRSISAGVSGLRAFEGAHSLVIDQIRIESPISLAVKPFELPEECHAALVESARQHLRRSIAFPTFQARFKGPPEEVKFQLHYELIMNRHSTDDSPEQRAQVREINNAAALGQVKIWPTKPSGQLELWFDHSKRDGNFVQISSTGACKRSPDLGDLFELGESAIIGRLLKDHSQLAFLAASLWHSFGTEAGMVTPKQRVETKDGKRQSLLEWTLVDLSDRSSVSFVFEQSYDGVESQLDLRSISLTSERAGALNLRLMVSYVGPVLMETDFLREMPHECIGTTAGQLAHENFPKLTDLIDPGKEVFYLKSQLFLGKDVPDSLFLSQTFALEEWLRFGIDKKSIEYRAEIKQSPHSKATSFLAYESSKELFQFSNGPADVRCISHHLVEGNGSMTGENHPSGEWILRELIEISSRTSGENSTRAKLAHLPIAVWLFASAQEDSSISQREVFELSIEKMLDVRQMELWFKQQAWQVEAKEFGIILRMNFEQTNVFGRRSQQFGSMEISLSPGTPGAVGSKLIVDIVNYRFESRKRVDEQLFLIPLGLGCKRSKLATQLDRSRDCKDVIAFQKLSPMGFNYKARLRLADETKSANADTLKLVPVLISGWLGRCPSKWDQVHIGPLRVSLQHRNHFESGRFESERRTMDELSERNIDELSGKCSIERSQSSKSGNLSDPDEVLRMDFSPILASNKKSLLAGGEVVIQSNIFSEIEVQRLQSVDETTEDGIYRSVAYERSVDMIFLNERLRGRGSIVISFRRELANKKTKKGAAADVSDAFCYHSGFKVDIHLHYPRAHLSLEISEMKFFECLDIVKEARVADCHEHYRANLGAMRERNFELEFKLIDAEAGQEVGLPEEELARLANERGAALERALERVLLLPPVALAPLQLAHWPQFKTRLTNVVSGLRSQVFAEFSLVEPLQFVHSFDKLDQQQIAQFGALTDAIQLTESVFSCSHLCETSLSASCFAFVYCANERTCHTLKRPAESGSPPTASYDLLKPLLRANANCTVYFDTELKPERERASVAKMLQSIESSVRAKQILLDLSPHANRSDTWSKLRLVGSKLRELTLGASSQTTNLKRSSSFALLRANARLDRRRWSEEQDATPVKFEEIERSSEGSCLELCERVNCRLGSYCSSTRLCSIVADLNRWSTFQALLNQTARPEQADCNIFTRNFLADYRSFELTRRPKNYHATLEAFTQLECAAACAMQDATEQGGLPMTDCLSFDFCSESQDEPPICYLNQMHLTMDDFDETILALQPKSDLSVRCTHFSRSLISDFRLVGENKRFSEHHTIVFKSMQLSDCALTCLRGETCSEFEYCSAGPNRLSSCYLRRVKAPTTIDATQSIVDADPNQNCNVYRLKHSEDHSALLRELVQGRPPLDEVLKFAERPHQRQAGILDSLVSLSLIALLLGSAVSFVYLKLAGARR